MRKFLVVGLAAFLVLGLIGAPSVSAKKKKKKKVVPVVKTFTEEGTIRVAGPTGAALKGVTEAEFTIANACGSMPVSQGHDGYVIEIPAEFQSGAGTLQVAGSDATGEHDLDVYFYDAGCTLMEPYLTNGADESGAILPGAKWAVVNLFVGANATFTATGTVTLDVVQ